MNRNSRTAFFDGIAERWDGWEDLPALHQRLSRGLADLRVGVDEAVLELGCGTGNLTRALLAHLSARGSVIAADLSSRMLAIARSKIDDVRVTWLQTEAEALALAADSCGVVLCCSVWPHLDDRRAAAAEFLRVLRPGGTLHVWHLGSRRRINEIHAAAGPAVRGDVLQPPAATAELLDAAGFAIVAARESDQDYLVTATKPER